MNAYALFFVLVGAASALVCGYVALTPTKELMQGAPPEFQPTLLDQNLPGWRRVAAAASLLVCLAIIALGFWLDIKL